MHRQVKHAIAFASVSVLLIAWIASAGAEPEGKLRLPDAAREAEQLYAKQLKDLRAEFEARQREAWRTHVEGLTALQEQYTATGDLDGALAIRARIEELRDPPKAVEEKQDKRANVGLRMDALRGTWMVTWSDHRKVPREFHGRTQVDDGGHLYRSRGELIIRYPNAKVERITIGEERLVFEHFNPGKTYPKGKAHLLGIATKVE